MNDTICGICREDSCDFETRCGHFFHESCLITYFAGSNITGTCPYCRRAISKSSKVESLLKKAQISDFEGFEFEKDDIAPLLKVAVNDKSLPSKMIIEKCIEKGWGINEPLDYSNSSLIHLVADSGRLDLLEFIILAGVDLNSSVDRVQGTPLHYASVNRDLDMIKILISNGANLNIKNVNSETPLHIAAAYDGSDNYEIVKLMIENGADLSILDRSCRTPLHVALLYQADLKIINLFAEQGVFNSATCLNECFLLACRIEDTSYFDYFIEKGANPSYKSEFDQTGLYFASHFGQIDIVKRLLNYGVDVNVTDCYGSTPLLAASELGFIDLVKLLLSHGANLNAINPVIGWTAFQVACLNKNTELADFLLESGADISIKSAYQQEMFKSLFEMPVIFEKVMERITDFNVPILHAICEVDNYEMLVEYINNGYNFESLNHKGETPLFHAKDPEIIEELLGRSVDLNFRSSDGITPLSKTCMTGNMTLFKKLIEMETVDIHALCIKNRSALAYAVFHGELEMIKILLDKGLDANHVDSHQFTPVALILEGYCKLYMDNREVANEKALEMILVLKNAGGIFLHVGGYDRYRENVVVKAYFELVADE